MKIVLSSLALAMGILAMATIASAKSCYIDVAICGIPTPGLANLLINQQSDWILLHSHSISEMTDGTMVAEFLLDGLVSGDLCYGVWYGNGTMCSESNLSETSAEKLPSSLSADRSKDLRVVYRSLNVGEK